MTDRVQEFLDKLTNLCNEYGYGIEGGQLYIYDHEDYAHSYIANNEDKIIRL